MIRRGSKIHGLGIFSDKHWPAKSLIYSVPFDHISLVPKRRWAKLGEKVYVNDELILNWINHSCDPSAELVNVHRDWYLKARRDIFPEEEITCDYNLTEIGGFKVECGCKSHKCRGYFLCNR